MTIKQTLVVKPLGVITTPNEMGQYPVGAMDMSQRPFAIRDPGKLVSPGRMSSLIGVPAITGPATKMVLCANSLQMLGVYLSNAATWRYNWTQYGAAVSSDAAFGAFGFWSGLIAFPTDGRMNFTRNRNRPILNGTTFAAVWDYEDPSSAAQRSPRLAGVPPPVCQTVTASSAGPVDLGTRHCSLVVVYRKAFPDGYELTSPPSAALQFGGPANNTLGILVSVSPAPAVIAAGDWVDVYRTLSQPNDGATPGTNTGSVYRLSTSHQITSAEAVAGNFQVLDTTLDTALGEFLYTNASEGTADAAHLPPPAAKCLSTFKGCTFYLNCTDPASLTLNVSTAMAFALPSSFPYARAHGIGTRNVTGNVSTGSAVISSISAADMVGILLNMQSVDSRFGGSATVTAVGATTITMSANSTATATATQVPISDVIEIATSLNSVHHVIQEWNDFAASAPQGVSIYAQDLSLPDTTKVGLSAGASAYPAEGWTVAGSRTLDGSFTIRATHGDEYVPKLPRIELNETALTVSPDPARKNGVSWSEPQQPESVPSVNTTPVGSGEIYAAEATRDALWIFASDGLWRLSGTGGSAKTGYDWRVDPVDTTLILSAPRATCVLNDVVYAYTNRGLVAIGSDGTITPLSRSVVDATVGGPPWLANYEYTLIADERFSEIIFINGVVNGESSTQALSYNVITGCWTLPIHTSDLEAITEGVFVRAFPSPAVNRTVFFTKNTGFNSGAGAYVCERGNPTLLGAGFQPIYGESPFGLTRWIEAEFATLQSSGTATYQLGVNGKTPRVSTARTANAVDAAGRRRVAFGFSREDPAVSPSVNVQAICTITDGQVVALEGIAITYEQTSGRRTFR
jgi:hypothetical protein